MTGRHFGEIRALLKRRVHADFAELERHIDDLEREVADLESEVADLRGHHCGHDQRPAHITLTTSQEGKSMGSYTAGTTVDLTAVVTAEVNGATVQISDTLTWTSDQGTVTAGPNSADANGNVVMTATLANAPVGTANVTATTSNGLPATDAVVFTEAAPVPSAISLTDSADPAATTPSA